MKKKKTGIDALNPGEQDDKREAYRYHFNDDQRPSLIFLGKPVLLINISAGGLAFKNGDFSLGDTDQIHLNLNIPGSMESAVLTAKAKIFHISREGICRCSFEDMPPDQAELIHKYVLEMQKKDLRS